MEDRADSSNFLVVGGTSGIGAAVVQMLISERANVIFCGTNRDAGAALVRSVSQSAAINVKFIPADVTDERDVTALFEQVEKAFGVLHGAFNAAGVVARESVLGGVPFHESSEEDFDRVLGVNVKGIWRCLRHELAMMARQGFGSVVNCSSVAGLRSADSMSASYTASKHALVGLSRSLAVEYARCGIRVNAVCPGVIDTPMLGRMREELLQDIKKKNPSGEIGTPGDVAEAVVFLLSKRSKYINGTTLTVDAGGLTGAL